MVKQSDTQWDQSLIMNRVVEIAKEAGRPTTPVYHDWAHGLEPGLAWELMLQGLSPVPPTTEQISDIKNQLVAQEAKTALDKCISILTEIREDIRHGIRVQSAIYSIGVAGDFLLRTPVSILLEEDEEGVLASAPEFEVVGEGPTEPDAIADLKMQLGELHLELMSTPDEELGPLPLSWKRILLHLTISDDSQV
jgi:hypothetical protein